MDGVDKSGGALTALLVLLLAAVLCVAGVGYVSWRRQQISYGGILAAGKDLPAGTLITRDLLEHRRIPMDLYTRTYVDEFEKVVGRRIVVDLARGDPLHTTFLAEAATVCRPEANLAAICESPRSKRPCKVQLSGTLTNTRDCQAFWDGNEFSLGVSSHPHSDIVVRLTMEASDAGAYVPSYGTVSVSERGGALYLVEFGRNTPRRGSLSVHLDELDPALQIAHGSLEATLVRSGRAARSDETVSLKAEF